MPNRWGSARKRRRWPLVLLLGLLPALLAAVPVDTPPLVDAAKAQDWALVRTLLEKGEDVSATATDGATALHWASYWDEVETVRLLIRAGADVNAVNDLGATALWIASLNGSGAMVNSLLDAGADPNAALPSGETPVMTAARTGNPGVMERLLQAGGDVDARGTRGQTPLMWAVSQKHSEVAQVLLEHGADVHARSDSWGQMMAVPPYSDPANQKIVPHGGNTPLLFASRVGDLASVSLLVAAGANVDDTDAWGVSATALAVHSGFSDIAVYLLERGADPNLSEPGFSALHLAIMRRDQALVRVLLDHGADANATLESWTPTRRASDDWYIHQSLVGASPFWLAARFTQPGVMRLLVEHGADPLFVHHADYVGAAGAFGAAPRQESTTAIMAAVGMGGPRRMRAFVSPDPTELEALTMEAVRICAELGVDVSATDLEGRTYSALDAPGFPSVADFLAQLSES